MDASRRGFFRGRSRQAAPLRPPWALPEANFLDVCTRCDGCLSACPTRILKRGDGGFPTVDFSQGECTFCGDCRRACPSGALGQDPAGPPWTLHLRIGEHCLPAAGVECRVCGDYCEPRALRFQPQPGGIAHLQLLAERCTGCGACIAPCPVGALSLTSSPHAGPA